MLNDTFDLKESSHTLDQMMIRENSTTNGKISAIRYHVFPDIINSSILFSLTFEPLVAKN